MKFVLVHGMKIVIGRGANDDLVGWWKLGGGVYWGVLVGRKKQLFGYWRRFSSYPPSKENLNLMQIICIIYLIVME